MQTGKSLSFVESFLERIVYEVHKKYIIRRKISLLLCIIYVKIISIYDKQNLFMIILSQNDYLFRGNIHGKNNEVYGR